MCDLIFDKFSVDKYLISEGLAVEPKYRRQGLGEALLRVHVTICLEQHVDVTASLFISDSSNRLADKLNYQCLDRLRLYSISFSFFGLYYYIIAIILVTKGWRKQRKTILRNTKTLMKLLANIWYIVMWKKMSPVSLVEKREETTVKT